MKYKWILAISLIVLVFISGCLETKTLEKRIGEISCRLHTSREAILQINYSKIETEIEILGYTCTNGTGGGIIDYSFSKMENNSGYPALVISIFSSTTNSSVSGYYNPVDPFPESELGEKKQYFMDRVNEIAQICNLTIDWGNAQWGMSYQPGKYSYCSKACDLI